MSLVLKIFIGAMEKYHRCFLKLKLKCKLKLKHKLKTLMSCTNTSVHSEVYIGQNMERRMNLEVLDALN